MIILFALLLQAVAPGAFLDAESPGDLAYAAIRYDDAAAAYEAALRAVPDTPELLWRLARVHISMGEVVEGDAREEHFRAAERYARACVRRDSLNPRGHTWLAAALGNIASFEGSRTKVRLAREIRTELDAALALDPDDDVALSVLGSFHRALGNVSWLERQLAAIFLGSLPEGGFEDAEKTLGRAVALAPNVIRHHFELALLHLDRDRPELARPVLEHCLTLPVLVASDRPTLARIRTILDGMR